MPERISAARPRRRVAAVAAILGIGAAGLGWLLAGPVLAHALLQSSDPAAGATLGSSPTAITMTFGEQPDPRLSTVKVLTVTGAPVEIGPVEAVAGHPVELRVSVGPLPDGVYTVTWRTVSAVDGHVAAGTFSFGVGVAPPAPGTAASSTTSNESPSASPEATTTRAILYVGLIGLLGASFVALLLGSRKSAGIARMIAGGWVLSALGTVGLVAVQWLDAGSDLGTILGSSIGTDGIWRIVVVAVGGLPVAWLWRRRVRAPDGRVAALLCGAGAMLSMLVDVATGHAAADSPQIVTIAVQWFHVVAAGVWLGGLAGLLVAIRGTAAGDDSASLVRHFSTAAGFGLVIVAGTGLLRAVSDVGTWDALTTTDFGRLIVVKSVLLVGLTGLGAVNRFRNVGRAGRTLRPLRIVGGIEVSTGFVVLLATAILVNLVPPTRAGAAAPTPQPGPVIAAGSDFGTTVRLRLAVSPGAPGTNRFDVAVTDYDAGTPLAVDGVSLRFTPASATGIPASRLDLQPEGTGAFQGSGGNLSLDGIWKVTAVVARQGGGIEVPLVLSTVVPTQQVDVVTSAGAPTLYTVHLDATRSVQLYLDPGRAGQNDLHTTFFAGSTEMPISKATIAAGPVGGGQTLVQPRLLEPGHFVGQADPTAGKLAVDVVAAAPDGTPLHVHLQMDVVP
jgi:copper transport protein